MTQKQIEQTRVIAEYDGWRVVKRYPSGYGGGDPLVPLITEKRAVKLYLTDLNALHSVAMDVMEALSPHRVAAICLRTDIKSSILSRPINGEYIDLFNAVYDGIVFINEQKQ